MVIMMVIGDLCSWFMRFKFVCEMFADEETVIQCVLYTRSRNYRNVHRRPFATI